MKKILLLAIIAVAMVGCSKNQRKVNKISGTWKATSYKAEIEGIQLDLAAVGDLFNYEVTYDKCKLKEDEFCTYSESYTFLTATTADSGLFRVAGDGDRIETKDDFSSTTIVSSTIEYIAGKEMKINRNDPEFGEVVIKLEKQ